MLVSSTNSCKYIASQYYSCAVDSFLDLCQHSCLPKIANSRSDLGLLTNAIFTDSTVGQFLAILLSYYEKRLHKEMSHRQGRAEQKKSHSKKPMGKNFLNFF